MGPAECPHSSDREETTCLLINRIIREVRNGNGGVKYGRGRGSEASGPGHRRVGVAAQTLTTKQRKAATRSRKGMERVVPTLATLSTEHGVSVPKQPTSTMTSNLEIVTQLEAVQQKLTGILANVGNNVDASRSTSWNTATTLYGMLQKVAHRDPQLKSQLAPVKEFFAYRTPAAKNAHPKQKGKKEALAKEKEAAAQAAAESSAMSAPTALSRRRASSVPASPTASAQVAPVAASVAVPHS
jgi:hypothetical protein